MSRWLMRPEETARKEIQRLAAGGLWLEQEALALDPRLTGYLEGLLAP